MVGTGWGDPGEKEAVPLRAAVWSPESSVT